MSGRSFITWKELKAELTRNKVRFQEPRSNRTSGWTVIIEGSGTVDPGSGLVTRGVDAELISQAHGEQGDAASHALFNLESVYDAFREAAIQPTNEFLSSHPPPVN